MSDALGLTYAILICGLGGFIGQYVFQFFKPRLGLIWGGGVAALIAFFAMVMIAALTQAIFQYPQSRRPGSPISIYFPFSFISRLTVATHGE